MEDWCDVDDSREISQKPQIEINQISNDQISNDQLVLYTDQSVLSMLSHNHLSNPVQLTEKFITIYKKYSNANKFELSRQLLLVLTSENIDNERKVLIIVQLMDIFGYPQKFLQSDLRDYLLVLLDTNPSFFKTNKFTKMMKRFQNNHD